MENNNAHFRLIDAVDNYYLYNPDTLMPLVMIALAAHGKLSMSQQPQSQQTVFATLSPQEVVKYDWVRYDPVLKKRIQHFIDNQVAVLAVVGELDESVRDIYDTFHHYDTYTVDEEYHHRIGLLYDHSSNEANDQAHRQYATICLAEALLSMPADELKPAVLQVSNYMLVKSGLQPERPRLEVAETFDILLQYDGQGDIYNPFAGCGIAAAMLEGGEHLWADGNGNDKLFAAARILNYGMGGSNAHFEQHDSTHWRPETFDYILNTYTGYVNGKTAFDFCLSKCFESLNEKGRFVGMISPKDIFEKQSPEMREAMKRDWLDTIVLLPFGEVAVLINTCKEKYQKKVVRFFNMCHPMLCKRPVYEVLLEDRYAHYFDLSDVRKKGFFKELLVPDLRPREEYVIVRLGDYVEKKRRQTYSLSHVPVSQRVMASIDRKKPYNSYSYGFFDTHVFLKSRITSLFSPAYLLSDTSLITNMKGDLEPRIYDMEVEDAPAYFQDGYAFQLKDENDAPWLMEELNQSYVARQLHPYGFNKMVPEALTEEQILNLKIYRKIEEASSSGFGDEELEDDEQSRIPVGHIIVSNNVEYTIQKFLGHGYFGYTYRASSYNRATGEEESVVLKEYYPFKLCRREGIKAVPKDEISAYEYEDNLPKFLEEGRIMQRLGNIKDSHVVPVYDRFYNASTDSHFYVMPFYELSLYDLAESGHTFSEDMCIHQILEPICKALYLAHREGVLHLDIKPDNIMLDKEGKASLIDFGVAKQYDEGGNIINRNGSTSGGPFSAPELKVVGGKMVKFGPQPDLFSLAATVYYLICDGELPHEVAEFSDQDEDLREAMNDKHCSPQFIDAIVRGLSMSASYRSKDALAFLRLFPGCENIQF